MPPGPALPVPGGQRLQDAVPGGVTAGSGKLGPCPGTAGSGKLGSLLLSGIYLPGELLGAWGATPSVPLRPSSILLTLPCCCRGWEGTEPPQTHPGDTECPIHAPSAPSSFPAPFPAHFPPPCANPGGSRLCGGMLSPSLGCPYHPLNVCLGVPGGGLAPLIPTGLPPRLSPAGGRCLSQLFRAGAM